MLSLHNILLIAPPQQNPLPQSQINIISTYPGHIQSNFDESGRSLGFEERVCRDCGNRAKKECGFGRCRTCCKTKGYDCPTHVKSTWIPAAQRRERKVFTATGSSSSGGKRLRTEVSEQNVVSTSKNASDAAPSASLRLRTGSSHQDPHFKETLPGKVQVPAVFRRMRVTAVADGETQIAYQATVTISGHVFKGFLYDYGVDDNNLFPCISKLHQGNCNGGGNRECCSPIDHSNDPLAASNE